MLLLKVEWSGLRDVRARIDPLVLAVVQGLQAADCSIDRKAAGQH